MTDSVAQLLVELGSGKLPLTDILPFPSDSFKGNQTKSVFAFVEFAKQNNLEKALNEKKVFFIIYLLCVPIFLC